MSERWSPCLEIVDTRYKTYHFRAADNIADNSSSARLVRGVPLAAREFLLRKQLHVVGLGDLGSVLTLIEP